MEPETCYTYGDEGLPPRHFRLLQYNQPLDQYSLVEYSLDEAPKYEALSYAWEGQSRTCDIPCQGKTLPITPSVEQFLRRFRHNSPVSNPPPIWIDAVCINQDNLRERSQQVAIMREIYEKAIHTVVWLPGDFHDPELYEDFEIGLRTGAFENNNIDVAIWRNPESSLGYSDEVCGCCLIHFRHLAQN